MRITNLFPPNLYNYDTGEEDIFTFNKSDDCLSDEPEKNASEAEIDELNMWLYIKDKFNVSNEAWHEIVMKLVSQHA